MPPGTVPPGTVPPGEVPPGEVLPGAVVGSVQETPEIHDSVSPEGQEAAVGREAPQQLAESSAPNGSPARQSRTPAPGVRGARPAPAKDSPRSVERVVRRARADRGTGWHRRAKVMVGGLSSGRGDPEERAKARCRLPLPGPCRIVVLGCTSGAGQTATALMLGQLLASLRAEPVAALDLNPGDRSLTRQLGAVPVATVGGLLADAMAGGMASYGIPASSEPRLEVIASGEDRVAVQGLDENDHLQLADMLAGRYDLTLVDPAASTVARVLHIADQLVLVAPASADAPRAVAMTHEWLDSHGHAELAARAVTVINGVSKRSMADVVHAENVARGRSRAIVRVPWDDQLDGDRGPASGARTLRPHTRHAYTALAGVSLAGLAVSPDGAEVSR